MTRYYWYDIRPIRRMVAAEPGRRVTRRTIAERLGIPLEEVDRAIAKALERRMLRRVTAEEFEIPAKIYRVQKMRVYSTLKRPQLYRVRFETEVRIPTQLVLTGVSGRAETDELAEGTHGAVRIVVYTYRPEAWPEERLERIMRGLFAQERISLEVYSDLPYINVYQAYESDEIEPDEVPPGVEVEQVQIIVYFSLRNGTKLMYIYRRRPWGWEYERYEL